MQDLVLARDGQVFANSRDVAAKFGKQHKHVLDSIDYLIREGAPGFTEVQAPTAVGFGTRLDRAFDMTRDGFMLLAMGFTGKAALRWKLRYIEAFNTMEAQLRDLTMISERAPMSLADEVRDLRDRLTRLESGAIIRRAPPDRDAIVLRHIERDGVITRRELVRAVQHRLNGEQVQEAIAALSRRGLVDIVDLGSPPQGGRPKTLYLALGR